MVATTMDNKRHDFYREIVRLGASSVEDIKQKYPLGTSASQEQMQGWFTRFQRTVEKPIRRTTPRLVNSYKIGADPEFIFRQGTARLDARTLGLKTGLAFGADNNSRLVELRPKAYRNALKVVASILQELRWMAVVIPATQQIDWLAGAFLNGDGIGGHVHFGRKRETRDQEVDALANIMAGLVQVGVFPAQEVVRRMGGDERGQVYGRLNDIRLQSHGYEYRAFPSWLGSPWTTYLTLVLSKLAVYDPAMVSAWVDNCQTPAQWETAIRNLLTFYRGRDDDAELALWVLQQRGFPKHTKRSFRSAWGIDGLPANADVTVIPPCIGASPESVEEIWMHFVTGNPIAPNSPQLNWSPSTIPPGFYMLNSQDIHRHKGYGELVWDLCADKRLVPSMLPCEDEHGFYVSQALADKMPKDWMKQAKELLPMANFTVVGYTDNRIYIGMELRSPRIAPMAHKVLLSGLFPIWSVKTAATDSFAQWQEKVKALPTKSDKRRLLGQVLYESTI